jgi:hypothetical protein
MVKKTLDVHLLIEPESTASIIASKWQEYNSARQPWIREKTELRDYLYATDTRTTTNAKNGWFNSTTTPYLTQIYDNLKANYVASLFPQEQWQRWSGDDRESASKAKATTIQAYMENKTRQSDFRKTAERLVDDLLIYGNCFATVEFRSDYTTTEEGDYIPGYIGPKIIRISPYDIVFDPTASEFKDSPKIIRSLVSLGEIKSMAEGGDPRMVEAFARIMSNRQTVISGSGVQVEKSEAFVADGFGSIELYYSSQYVEILTFYGDLYDINSGTLHSGRKITVVDRAYVLSNEPIASWLGSEPIRHAGWRDRPDNLWAMGPLDNLVGMQYRIDHLENLKADVWDQIAYPVLKIRGYVEDFEYTPGAQINLGEEGDVSYLVPDATALNADLQIRELQNRMEEIAGAPRQAMGIRTPGEKTAFEVQTLDNASGRMFQHKTTKFEMEFLEPVLNDFLECGRRNMDRSDLIRVLDDETGVFLFESITKEDITAKGKITPMGARHFAERARRVQNILQMNQLKQDPTIGAHLSGKEIAKVLATELGEPAFFGENIAVEENAETQKAALDAEADLQETLQVAAEEGL